MRKQFAKTPMNKTLSNRGFNNEEYEGSHRKSDDDFFDQSLSGMFLDKEIIPSNSSRIDD